MNNLHSQFLLRRFSFDKMKEDIDNIVDYELNPCEFDNVELFIYGACNMLAYRYFEDSKLSDKESEKLYPSIVNLFEEHLTDCAELSSVLFNLGFDAVVLPSLITLLNGSNGNSDLNIL